MSARTVLIGSTLLMVAALLVGGIYYPNDFFMHFAASSPLYTVLRGSIIAILIGLLITDPPRSTAFRTVVASWAALLASLSVNLLITYQVNLFDIVVFIQLAIIFTIEALEPGTSRAKTTPVIPKKAAR